VRSLALASHEPRGGRRWRKSSSQGPAVLVPVRRNAVGVKKSGGDTRRRMHTVSASKQTMYDDVTLYDVVSHHHT
jgi:hypothetical protein